MYVGKRTIECYISIYRATGDISPKHQRHGPLPAMNEFEEITVLQMLLARPSMYLHEIQEDLYQVTGSNYHSSTIHRAIKRLGMSRRLHRHVPTQRCGSQIHI